MKIVGSGSMLLSQLGMLVGVAWWGLLAYPGALSWIVGIGLPVVLIVLWQQFLTPDAPMPIPESVKAVVRVGLLLTGAAAFWAVGVTELAVAQVILTLISATAPWWARRGKSPDAAGRAGGARK